ncbi:MAG: hypothetical protein IPO40_23880 [Fibrobacteres bacterium]|nr:hypothetical protein [Fibrobacterota bacterium]
MNIYLSEFYCSDGINRNKLYGKAIDAVTSFCNEKSVTLFRSEVHRDYDLIENEIHCSNLLVAIIDEYWTSSTWKCHEYTFAIGHISMNKPNIFGPNIPIVPFIIPGIKIPPFVEETLDRFVPIHNIPSLINRIDEAYQAIKQ